MPEIADAPSLVVLAAGMARRYGGCKPLAPIGPHGEPVLDLLVGDAVRAGFGRIVLVLHPESGPSIRYHVDQCWPAAIDVEFVEQRLPLGTVHAVLAAEPVLGPGTAFGVSNADDVYGQESMGLLADQLRSATPEHALVGFALRATVATADPVTRGICTVGPDGLLVALDERRQVHPAGDSGEFASDDGLRPERLAGDLLTSVNLWGFRAGIWDVFHGAMDASGLDVAALVARVAAGAEVPRSEVLLPEVVSAMVAGGDGLPVRVLPTDGELVGVTHAADLPVVSAGLARQMAFGLRPAALWAGIA